MSHNDIERIKRICAGVVALSVWWLSITFSNAGFNFQISGYQWGGWVLGFAITICELVFNSQLNYKSTNLTVYVIGFASYAYGIYSNYIGILFTQGITNLSSMGISLTTIFPLFIALFAELTPEVLLIYSLAGITQDGDFFRNLLGITREVTEDKNKSQNNNQGNNNNQKNNNQNENNQNNKNQNGDNQNNNNGNNQQKNQNQQQNQEAWMKPAYFSNPYQQNGQGNKVNFEKKK